MNFKTRKIRHNLKKINQALHKPTENPSQENNSESEPIKVPHNNTKHHNTIKYLTIAVGIGILLALFFITISLVKSIDFGSLIFSFGKQLKSDNHGHTNFLLVGIGGENHDGGNLTDTIILASLDEKSKTVKMLSIPRDLYIEDKPTGGQRINKIYDTYYNKLQSSNKGLDKLAETVTDLTGMSIQYKIKVDFGGFVKIVDALGGITVNVENPIHDPFYPMGETIKYQTFDISAGIQDLDGATALKYARSRKTTSDFDRAKRQQQILSSIKEKALSINLLTDAGKLQNLYNSLSDSISTDLTVAEILALAKTAKDIQKDQIESRVISDDFTSCGGFLYTPNRDLFGGAAILLPAGNEFDEIRRFSKNYFESTSIGQSPIQVLNATKSPGLALTYLNRLSRECLNVTYYGNATNRDQEHSVIYYNKDQNGLQPSALESVKSVINAVTKEGIPEEYLSSTKRSTAVIVVEIGADYKSLTSSDPFSKLLYTAPTEPVKSVLEKDTAEPINIRSTNTTSAVTTKTVTSTIPKTTITSSTNKPAATTPATITKPSKPTAIK